MDEKHRYRKGERVVIVGLRHKPQAEVLLDQPRSSNDVRVRELSGSGLNRRVKDTDLILHEDWLRQQPEAAPPGQGHDEILARFRQAMQDYLQSHTVPPKGKGHNQGVKEAYDYALAAAEARRYYDLGRGYTGRFLKAKRERKVGLNTPDPIASADEQLGVSLAKVGARVLKEHYRGRKEVGDEVELAAEPVAEDAKPKLEIHVDLPAEVFTGGVGELIAEWVQKSTKQDGVGFLPGFGIVSHFTGISYNDYARKLGELQDRDYVFIPVDTGWFVIPPQNGKPFDEQVKDADLPTLRHWFGLLLDEIGERTKPGQ